MISDNLEYIIEEKYEDIKSFLPDNGFFSQKIKQYLFFKKKKLQKIKSIKRIIDIVAVAMVLIGIVAFIVSLYLLPYFIPQASYIIGAVFAAGTGIFASQMMRYREVINFLAPKETRQMAAVESELLDELNRDSELVLSMKNFMNFSCWEKMIDKMRGNNAENLLSLFSQGIESRIYEKLNQKENDERELFINKLNKILTPVQIKAQQIEKIMHML